MTSLKASWEKATEKGIVDGKRPYASVTRQEVAVIAMRAAERI